MKIFKNRITQETPNKMRKMKSLWIGNMDKEMVGDTPHGLFALSLHPNQYVDEVELEKTFKSILSHYYQWKYGSKWRTLTNIQNWFEGVIETQQHNCPHIHLTIYQFDIAEVSIFVSYIKEMMKSIYHKTTYRIKKVYDIKKWNNYTSPEESEKDTYKTKRRITSPLYISAELFGARYTE